MLHAFCYFELHHGFINAVMWVCCYCALRAPKVHGYATGARVLCALSKSLCTDKRNSNMISLNLKLEIEM